MFVKRMFTKVSVIAALIVSAIAVPSYGAVVVHYVQDGANVVATVSGSLDLTNTTGTDFNCLNSGNPCTPDGNYITRGADISQLSPITNFITNFYSGDKQIEATVYQITGPTSETDAFGTSDDVTSWSSPVFGDSGSGDANTDFILRGDDGELYLEASYTSGAEMNATWTFVDTTLAQWGVGDPSEFVFTLVKDDPTGTTDTFIVRFGGASTLSAVPLPASVLFLAMGISGLGVAQRWRRDRVGRV